MAGWRGRDPGAPQHAVALVDKRVAARHVGVEVDADRDRHAVAGPGPIGHGARHVGRGRREVHAVARAAVSDGGASAGGVGQAHAAQVAVDDEIFDGRGRHRGAVVAVPDAEQLAAANLKPEVVLSVDVKGRHRRRRRNEDEAGHHEDLGLLRLDQRPHSAKHVEQELLVARDVLDVVERDPGAGRLDPLEDVIDVAAVEAAAPEVDLRGARFKLNT